MPRLRFKLLSSSRPVIDLTLELVDRLGTAILVSLLLGFSPLIFEAHVIPAVAYDGLHPNVDKSGYQPGRSRSF